MRVRGAIKMTERHLTRRGKTNCPKCDGHKGICGKSVGVYPGVPATFICDRCAGSGEVWEDSLTEAEKNPPAKRWFDRDDNP